MVYNGIDLGSYLNAYEYKGVDDIPISATMWSPTLGDGGKISLFRRPTVTVTLMAVIETDEAGTLVTSAGAVEPGQRIHVSLRSGSLTAQVTQIQEEDRHA